MAKFPNMWDYLKLLSVSFLVFLNQTVRFLNNFD